MKTKVLIHYPFIASYRIPIFNELSKNDMYDFHFLSDTKSDDSTLKSNVEGWEFNHHVTQLKVFRFANAKLFLEFGVLKYILRYANTQSYYVILSNPNIITSWFYTILARLVGYKVVFWGHGLIKQDVGIKGFCRRLYYKIPNQYWLYGNIAKSLMTKTGIPSKKLSVIYNSLDYELQKKIRDEYRNKREVIRLSYGFSEKDFVLIVIGRLLKKLEIDKIILALKLLSDTKLIVIGDGPEMDNLKSLTLANNLNDCVIFTGAIYDEQHLGEYFTSSDASVVMGIVGLSAMHSLAYGIPMITHSNMSEHCPEVESIKPDLTGEFFEKNNVDSLRFVIEKIKANKSKYYDNCINEIEKHYTPSVQMNLILKSLDTCI
jgi:glycosyltransferase involved in cell wall biosynthesis